MYYNSKILLIKGLNVTLSKLVRTPEAIYILNGIYLLYEILSVLYCALEMEGIYFLNIIRHSLLRIQRRPVNNLEEHL
jgi:hypothetical protein